MGQFGDSRLFYDARGALERMHEAQNAPDQILPSAASLEFEHILAKPLQEIAGFDSEILVLILRHSLCTRSRLDEPGQFARQPAQLHRGLKRLVRACLCFLGGLGNVRNRAVHLLDGRRLLFRAELDFSRGRGRGP